jgi:hypothetical protein
VKDFLPATITDGRANLELPYHFALPDGKPKLEVKNGSFAIESLTLAAPNANLPSFKLGALKVDDIALNLVALPDGSPRIDIKSGKIAAESFALSAAGADSPLIAIGAVTLEELAVDLAARAVNIAALRVTSPEIRAQRDENGEIDLVRLLTPKKQEAPSAPWQIKLATLELSTGSVAFNDRVSGLAPALKDIAVKLGDVTGDFSRPVAFEVAAAIVSGGTLSTRGRASPGGAVEAQVTGTAIALAPLQPLLARHLNATLTSGEAAFSGNIKTGQKESALVFAGGASVNNVQLNDPTGVLLAGWKSLGTTGRLIDWGSRAWRPRRE